MCPDQAEHLRNIHKETQKIDSLPFSDNTIVFMSGKGGVGKSLISLNSCILMAEQKKKVLLVDSDFIKPSLHILANISPKYSVEIWLKEKEYLLKDIIIPLSPGVDLLSPEGEGYYSNLKDWQYTSLIRRVIRESRKYDVVVFDFPTGYFPFMNTVLFEVKNIILVTTSEPTSIIDTYAMIKVLNNEIPNKKIKVLINQAEDEDDSTTSVENLNQALSHFLSFEVEALPYLPFTMDIKKSVKQQKPIGYINSAFEKDFFNKLAYSLQSL